MFYFQFFILVKTLMNTDDLPPESFNTPQINYWKRMHTHPPSQPSSSSSSRVYYYNRLTKQTTWKKPIEYAREEKQIARLRSREAVIATRRVTLDARAMPKKGEEEGKVVEEEGEWVMCVTNLGHVFWWHEPMGRSDWKIPEEIREKVDAIRQRECLLEPSQRRPAEDVCVGCVSVEPSRSDIMGTGTVLIADYGSDDDDDEQHRIVQAEEDEMEFGVDDIEDQIHEPAEEEEEVMSMEEREREFRGMLGEMKEVDAYATYDLFEPKLVRSGDARFHLLGERKDRKRVFDEYCGLLQQHTIKNKSEGGDGGGGWGEKEFGEWVRKEAKKGMLFEEFWMMNKKDRRLQRLEKRRAKKLFENIVKRLR